MSSKMKTFGVEDIEHFKKKGYVILKGAFSKETARQCREAIWDIMTRDHNIEKENEASWPEKVTPRRVFSIEDGLPWSDVFTDRFRTGVNQLLGENKWIQCRVGWWMITFPKVPSSSVASGGAAEQSDKLTGGHLHVDGHWYQHYPFSHQLGLVPLIYYNDVAKGAGGTSLVVGSHKKVASMLIEAGPAGLSSEDISNHFQNAPDKVVEEVCVGAGDMVLMHPWLIHGRRTNEGTDGISSVRFLSHPSIGMKEPLQFSLPMTHTKDKDASVEPSSTQHSPLEESILEAMETTDMLKTLRSLTPEVCYAYAEAEKQRVLAQAAMRESSCSTGNRLSRVVEENKIDDKLSGSKRSAEDDLSKDKP